jgi:hypothetical protein
MSQLQHVHPDRAGFSATAGFAGNGGRFFPTGAAERFSLVYGLQLPSAIYAAYAFGTKLTNEQRALPRVHLIAKNRLTQYMGAASAYAAVLTAIDGDVKQLLKTNPEIFDFRTVDEAFVEVRDFQTTGVVAFAKGLPFSRLGTGRQSVNGQRVDIKGAG